MPISNQQDHPEGELHALANVDNISPSDFYQRHIKASQPVVLRGLSSQWPALKLWSIAFFKQLGSEHQVHIEQGNIMQSPTRFKHTNFSDYLNQLETQTPASTDFAYLSLFNIFEAFPQLKQQVDFSLLNQHKHHSSCFAWLGPANTVTGYHKDASDNMLAQIQGRKLVKLIAPAQTAYMYTSKKYDAGSTLSSVDADNYCPKQYPLFAKTKALYTVLHPGDALFIPKGWWHYIRSLDVSISINNFASTQFEKLGNQTLGLIKHYLHSLHLYGKECTCHMYENGKRIKRPL